MAAQLVGMLAESKADYSVPMKAVLKVASSAAELAELTVDTMAAWMAA